MRIAIADDIASASERDRLRGQPEAQFARHTPNADISKYANRTGFLSAAEKKRFEHENGIDTAEQMQIFVTGSLSYDRFFLCSHSTIVNLEYATDFDRFFLCSHSTIVNLEYATDFDGTDFILKGEKKPAASRNLIKTARLAFGDFLFKRRQNP